jgi:hypothetical protein
MRVNNVSIKEMTPIEAVESFVERTWLESVDA